MFSTYHDLNPSLVTLDVDNIITNIEYSLFSQMSKDENVHRYVVRGEIERESTREKERERE